MTVLNEIIREVFGQTPQNAQIVSGGCINHATRVEVGEAVYFVKYNDKAPVGYFAEEARSLRLLRSANVIRVPDVIRHADAHDHLPAYLILEWIESGSPARDFAARFGTSLAALHRHQSDYYGLKVDDGSLTPTADWVTFYREHRLKPEIEKARQKGLLPSRRAAGLDNLMEKVEAIIGGVKHAPSLLHGDLWSGNYMVDDQGEPVLIDPQSYYGDREAELAFTEMFGGFPPVFYRAYQDAYPLEPGYENRRPLYQLYHLLEHLNLFGESYGAGVDSVIRFYGATVSR